MRFMIIVKATQDSEAGVLPSAQMLREMGAYNEGLAKAGQMIAGEGLHPSSKGARVRFAGDKRSVIDGPFSETKELIAGFWILEAKSLQDAIEIIKRAPNPHGETSVIEIRQVYEAEGFGPELNAAVPEVFEGERKARARQDAQRAQQQTEAAKR